MLMPEISLEADKKRVEMPEWISYLSHRLIDIPKFCRKSNPRIGLETWGIKNTKEYDFSTDLHLSCLLAEGFDGGAIQSIARYFLKIYLDTDTILSTKKYLDTRYFYKMYLETYKCN